MTNRSLARTCSTLLAVALAVAPDASALTFTVDRTADAVDAVPGDGACAVAGGGCSLRAAIQEANASVGADTIIIPAGVHTLSIPGAGEDDGATGDLDVAEEVVIEGAGAAATILDGGRVDRVLDLGADTIVRRLTIRNGNADAENGGGVRATPFVSSMTVTIEDVVISGNDALNGGGIANEAFSALVLRRSTLTDNGATGGGALDNAGDSDGATLENVTISDNFAVNGDGFRCEGTLTVTHGTIVDDRISGNDLTLRATLLDNGASGSCAGATTVTSQGGNLERGTSCGLAGAGDQSGVDPMLFPLGDYGGETPTHAIVAASPAVDALASCTLAEDQRGVARPQDGDSAGGAACDVGAFETEPGFSPTTTTTTTASTTTTTLPMCTIEPTFPSAACRIQSLSIRFGGAAEPVKLATKLAKLLTKAGDRLPLAEEALGLGKLKKAKRQVSKAAKLTRKFGNKLGGRKGPKALVDEGTRTTLAAEASVLSADLFLLRDALSTSTDGISR